jgi:hypothetical protein
VSDPVRATALTEAPGSVPNIPGLYNYQPGFLAQWFAGRAAQQAGQRNAIVSFVGDSTTTGLGGQNGVGAYGDWTNALASGFVPRLTSLVSNSSWSSIFSDHDSNALDTVPYSGADARVALGSGMDQKILSEKTIQCRQSAARCFLLLNNTQTSSRMTFAPLTGFDTLTVYVPIQPGLGGPLYVDIDGTTVGNLVEDATGPGFGGSGILKATYSTTLARIMEGAKLSWRDRSVQVRPR